MFLSILAGVSAVMSVVDRIAGAAEAAKANKLEDKLSELELKANKFGAEAALGEIGATKRQVKQSLDTYEGTIDLLAAHSGTAGLIGGASGTIDGNEITEGAKIQFQNIMNELGEKNTRVNMRGQEMDADSAAAGQRENLTGELRATAAVVAEQSTVLQEAMANLESAEGYYSDVIAEIDSLLNPEPAAPPAGGGGGGGGEGRGDRDRAEPVAKPEPAADDVNPDAPLVGFEGDQYTISEPNKTEKAAPNRRGEERANARDEKDLAATESAARAEREAAAAADAADRESRADIEREKRGRRGR